ncbi:3-isopropylmalate dehydratase large subunit [Flavisphingomonas formosensis]|uniref:3-isopropylmalate dehydratase large subunit n=1 Tax=Flavisphingomonas formosensis TaxID=861534 RepID=UPI0012FBD583|nr:3-isopropylmalate dehydratase large subunit [Sphingomonas formosensis]
MPRTLFEKIWDDHVVDELGNGLCLIHIDRHFLHELSGSAALMNLDKAARKVRNRELTFATLDHVLETTPGRGMATRIPGGNDFLREMTARVVAHEIRFFDLDDPRQGIVHVIAPELGVVLPGMTFICGDSHTCTVGAVGAFAWGVGSSDSEHALATQVVIASRPKTMRVNLEGALRDGVTAKDVILALIGRYGVDGGSGYAVEFAGSVVDDMQMSGRFTLCNMAVEFGGRTGLIAPDETTFAYLKAGEFSPKGGAWDAAVSYWRMLPSDPNAVYDLELTLDCSTLDPQVTWGITPEQVGGLRDPVPVHARRTTSVGRASYARAIEYSGVTPNMPVLGLPIDGAFIGSCTNSRLDDLRAAAAILKGRKVASGVKAICTPGSTSVKRAAEAEGIDLIFVAAGFEWRESGCSLCASGSAGGESFAFGGRVIASTNRNFEDRMGTSVKAHLASPQTVAASAVLGRIADVRELEAAG